MNKKILIIIMSLVSTSVYAEDKSNDAISKWDGDIELGYARTTGNTDTESMHTKGKVINERVKWKHTASIEVTNKSDKGATTAKRTYMTGKSDYKINELSYLFAALSYENDEFSGYDYQYSETLGYGYFIIKKDNLKVDVELGAGARQSKLNSGANLNEGTVKAATDIQWKISKTSTFNQFLSVEVGEENTITRSVTSLKLLIVGNLSAKLTHTIKNSSDVPVGTKKTDTESIVTLMYSF